MSVPKGIKKRDPDGENSHTYLSFGEKIVKIVPVEPKIALLKVKKKLMQAKYIARSAT